MIIFCVIQEIKNKTCNSKGQPKELQVSTNTFSQNGRSQTYYSYYYSSECFERTNTTAYKISIHKSYREKGKVKKKQYVIATMGYYDLMEYWIGDFITDSKLNSITKELNITEEELWDIVYLKLQPLIDKATAEYEATDEYKVHKEHEAIIKAYREAESEFDAIYGQDRYKYCYDVFGNLRNKAYLEQLKQEYEKQKKAESSYYEKSYSNYNNNYNSSSYYRKESSNYNDTDKVKLKKIYKTLAKNFHPDLIKFLFQKGGVRWDLEEKRGSLFLINYK